MPGYFYCQHCGNRTRKNHRLKTGQKYCGSKTCQQVRKNAWERLRFKKDPLYHQQRLSQKARWREKRPGHEYQKEYRQSHPHYEESNRNHQLNRNKNTQKCRSGTGIPKIVKTDALIAESLLRCGLYEIRPCRTRPGEKIVKTDALIVEIRAHSGFQKVLVPQSG